MMLRRSRWGGDTVTAIGTQWRASLVSDQRGPVLTRRAKTRSDAFAQAHRLLDDAEDRQWFKGSCIDSD